MNITGMSEQWVSARIQKKGEGKCIPWMSLRDLILTHPDVKKKIDVFALCIYSLVIFPKALRHVDEIVTDLFDQLDKVVTHMPAILAETFRSFNACRRTGEGRFIGCAQLLLAWFHSHLWKVEKVSYRFVPTTYGLAQCEFSYKGESYKKKVKEISNAWNQIHRMKRRSAGPMTTLEYSGWRIRKVNDNIPEPNPEGARSREECLRVVQSKLEIVKQDFEKMSSELRKRIEKLEEEKMHLKLDADV
ncbi:Nucleoside-triphosphatase THEP1 [Gossypium australe]|uniref:Nucleoside-triphosphatase THEP1 n=1 Tax=Gossypium australe TaxID=47621 RepID=A0A5B6UXL8_9ROSI|nr:Nucleoside-triphosphatase THEP1 [Gossypium australe]